MKITTIKITCPDGFELTGTAYFPTQLQAALMIAPATGIKRIFYNAFASYLAENGYGVICFDNRGIGDSKNGRSINACNASLVTWGELDMPAVLEKLKELFPNVTYHVIGHSAGGQLVGLMHNAKDIHSIFNFAASSGNLKNMHYPFKIKAFFFLNIFIPVNNLLFGRSNNQWMGMGEPLPRLVGQQWSHWCNGHGYVATDFGKAITKHWYDSIKIPSKWVHATDDDIANHTNVKEMIRIFSKIDAEILSLAPKEYGYKEIGHMRFFSSKYKKLWDIAVDWFNNHTNKNK